MKKYWTGFWMAWGMFCWIPCPHKVWDEKARSAMLATLPGVGLLMGLLWYGAALLSARLGLPPAISALVTAVFPLAISGGIHFDGFMDCCDALKSGRSIEEKQRILKDSHSGAFAIVGFGLVLICSFAAALAIFDGGMSAIPGGGTSGEFLLPLMLIPVFSRAVSVLDVMRERPMGGSQYSGEFEKQQKRGERTAACLLLAAACLVYLLIAYGLGQARGAAGGVPAEYFLKLVKNAACVNIGSTVAAKLFGAYARKGLGGMNGDIAGYEIVLYEAAALLLLAVL